MANAAPVFWGAWGNILFLADPWVHLGPAATLTDADSADFDGGFLRIHWNGTIFPEDQLTIGGGSVSTAGANVLSDGVQVGTWSGGANGADLLVQFNAAATPAIAQKVLRAVRYGNTASDRNTSDRSAAVTANDGDGGEASANFTLTLQHLIVPNEFILGGVVNQPIGQAIVIDHDGLPPTTILTLSLVGGGGLLATTHKGQAYRASALTLEGTLAELKSAVSLLTFTLRDPVSAQLQIYLEGPGFEPDPYYMNFNANQIPSDIRQFGPISVREGETTSLAGLFAASYPPGFHLPYLVMTASAGRIGVQGASFTPNAGATESQIIVNGHSPIALDDAFAGTSGSFVYTYDGDVPPASITITAVYDGVTAVATVNILAVNDAPTTQATSASLAEDGVRVFQPSDFPFTDVENHALSHVVISSLPTSGAVKLDGAAVAAGQAVAIADIAAGKLAYAPGADFAGQATLSFKVRDDGGVDNGGVNTSAEALFTFTVTPQNDAPRLDGWKAAATQRTMAPLQPDLVLSDPDAGAAISGAVVSIVSGRQDGDRLSATATGAIAVSYDAQAGVLTLAGAGSVADYQAALRSVGFSRTGGGEETRSITFTATDEHGAASSAATLLLTLPALPPPPAAPAAPPSQAPAMTTGFGSLLRYSPSAVAPLPATVTTPTGETLPNPLLEQQKAMKALLDKVDAGQMTLRQAQDVMVDMADATTSVATMTYQFFTGRTPSRDGLDYLVSSPANPNDLNDGYYAAMSLENRYINMAVNLGRDGEGRAGFALDYGALSFADATAKAYGEIFGPAPPGKVDAILTPERLAYFDALGGDALGAKAAMVGWLFGEAAKSDLGPYAASNENFLYDLLDGTAAFGVDLGIYAGAGPNSVSLIGVG